MRRLRKAKIIATLGPSSSTPEVIRALFLAGADVFRLNLSHGTLADHARRIQIIRELESSVARPIAILLDMQGPKLRVGRFNADRVTLREGDSFRLDLSESPGDQQRASLPHPEVFQVLRPGSQLLIDDGKISLRVVDCGADFAQTEVVAGGVVSNNKGVNVPDVILPIPALTDKDKEGLSFGLDAGVDWVAPSFVQRPDDLVELRDIVGDRAMIITKFEKPAAMEHLKSIVALSDAVMVARGDLGV
ncbi:MAG: pyruvate kinase, partial [Gammaproteobacteria bacterium]|nr:pyruvate kinase [Gammaproteobacteria bacterium]